MTDVLSRTNIYEATLERIGDLRHEAVTARTMARAFDDYAHDIVHVLVTKGEVADQVAANLAEYATGRARVYAAAAARKVHKADELEADLS